jgi:hypothetical protein
VSWFEFLLQKKHRGSWPAAGLLHKGYAFAMHGPGGETLLLGIGEGYFIGVQLVESLLKQARYRRQEWRGNGCHKAKTGIGVDKAPGGQAKL